VIDFSGVPEIKLVDDAGRTFTARQGRRMYHLQGSNPLLGTTPPAAVNLDTSPVPDDVALNWTYTEEHKMTFDGIDRATLVGLSQRTRIGKPVKLIVDFPVERRDISVPFEFTDLELPPS
jgi:hypothetical protein